MNYTINKNKIYKLIKEFNKYLEKNYILIIKC